MLPRPKPGESEEDLLRFQQEFLKSQTTSSASVVKKPDKRKSEEGLGECVRDKVKMEGLPAVAGPSIPHPLIPKKKTRFQAEVEERREQVSLMEDPEERLDKQDTHMAAVLTKILERDTQNAPVNMPTRCSKGFPTVLHRGQQDKSGSAGGGRKSLFAMQVSKISPKDFGLMVEQETTKLKLDKPSIDAASSAKVSETPVVIEGSGLSATFGSEEAKKIHEENLQKLHSMSEEEILAEKQKLLQMLDPKVVSFLKSKRTSKSVDTQMEDVAPENADLPRRKETPMEVLMDKSELPVKPNKEWVHMDQVEYDKMSWMKDLPTPKAGDSQTGQQARFDFHGNLISSSADIPVNVGLHHHGDEPERAGYTLEELFHLSRSTNIQQRCLALKTIANLLRNARNNALESLIQSPLLPVVLDAGIIFLLRWSLDDQVDAVVIHAISSLHALLVCQADEQALDRAFPWFQGHTSPSHKPVEESQEMTSPQNIDEEKPQETDADVLKKDVLLCLVTRMNILPRLKYILVKVRPQAPVVIEILEILTRIARHSPNLAYEIERHTGLLELIVEEFLPTSWRLLDCSAPISDVFGIPVTAAMRLIRVLAQSGRHLASTLVSKHHIQSRFLRYLVEINLQDLQLPLCEAYRLQTESFRTWRIFLSYGLCDSLLIDMFPSLLKRLSNLQTAIPSEIEDSVFNNHVAMIGALEMVVMVAGSHDKQPRSKFRQNSEEYDKEANNAQGFKQPALNWGHVAELGQMVSKITTLLLGHIGNTYQFKKFNLDLAVACLNFLASYYMSLANQGSYDPVSTLSNLEIVCRDILCNSLKSIGVQTVFQYVSQHSVLLHPPTIKMERHPSLPDLGTSNYKEDNSIPIIQELSPIGFVTATLRLLHCICKLHKGLQAEVKTLVMSEENLSSYHKKLVQHTADSCLSHKHFTKYENLLQYFYLKIAMYEVSVNTAKLDLSVSQAVGLKLLTRLHHGQEFIVHDLLSTVMFNTMLWSSGVEDMTSSLSTLNLEAATTLRNPTQKELSFTQNQLTHTAKESLPDIRATYITSMSDKEKLAIHSSHRFSLHPFETETLITPFTEECLLPEDWVFLPLINLYHQFSSVGADIQNALSTAELGRVSSVLKWIYLLERSQTSLMSTISPTLKISRIMCTFLTGNDLFLDCTVYCYLAALLREYTQLKLLDKLNFEEDIPGLVSFHDLYMAVLQQYEAVSYGDALFGCYILIPLQQRHNIFLRKAIWTENCGLLRILNLPLQESLIPLDYYLEPEETDVELVRLYLQGLLTQMVRPMWCPIIYVINIHHVNRFMYNQDKHHSKLRRLMLKQCLKCPNQELKKHLLHYKLFNMNAEHGLELYEELPPLRKSLMQNVMATLN